MSEDGIIGIVTGLDFEARSLRSAAGRSAVADRFRIVASGPGPEAARDCAEKLAGEGCGLLVSMGLAGGLSPDLRAGAAVLADRVHISAGAARMVDAVRHARLVQMMSDWPTRPVSGGLLSLDTVAPTCEAKATYHAETGALAVDMESAGVAEAAAFLNLPFLAVRIVADPAHRAIPPAALAGMLPGGGVDPLAVLRALLRRPHDLPGVLSLARDSRIAREALGRFGELFLPLLLAG